MAGPVARILPEGWLHLNHGPIDLICAAEGEARRAAYATADAAFGPMLDWLVLERATLSAPADLLTPLVRGPVAQRMVAAVQPYRDRFITPMAAVAGAGADHILDVMLQAGPLDVAWVNNGGDIALHLAPGQDLGVGLVRRLQSGEPDEALSIAADMGIGGVATSGWPGRSFSLGIADAVTVLAGTAAAADAAATVIANAVNADHPDIGRAPARTLDPDSDLLDLPVTTDVPPLPPDVVAAALDRGLLEAFAAGQRGLIKAAFLFCQGQSRAYGEAEMLLRLLGHAQTPR